MKLAHLFMFFDNKKNLYIKDSFKINLKLIMLFTYIFKLICRSPTIWTIEGTP